MYSYNFKMDLNKQKQQWARIQQREATIVANMKRLRDAISAGRKTLNTTALSMSEMKKLTADIEQNEEDEALMFYRYQLPASETIEENSKIKRIGCCVANLKAVDFHVDHAENILLRSLPGTLNDIFGFKEKPATDSILKTLCSFHDLAHEFTENKLESVKLTTFESQRKSKDMENFWHAQFNTLEQQKNREMIKLLRRHRVSYEDSKKMEIYIDKCTEDYFIVKACNTIKYMLDSILMTTRIRCIKPALEQLIGEKKMDCNDEEEDEDEQGSM